MSTITPDSLMTLEAYARYRKAHKAEVIAHRRLRVGNAVKTGHLAVIPARHCAVGGGHIHRAAAATEQASVKGLKVKSIETISDLVAWTAAQDKGLRRIV